EHFKLTEKIADVYQPPICSMDLCAFAIKLGNQVPSVKGFGSSETILSVDDHRINLASQLFDFIEFRAVKRCSGITVGKLSNDLKIVSTCVESASLKLCG